MDDLAGLLSAVEAEVEALTGRVADEGKVLLTPGSEDMAVVLGLVESVNSLVAAVERSRSLFVRLGEVVAKAGQ